MYVYTMHIPNTHPHTHLVGVDVGKEGRDGGAVLLLGGVEGGGDGALHHLVVEVGAGQFCVFFGEGWRGCFYIFVSGLVGFVCVCGVKRQVKETGSGS